jgi:hypothetical protein
VVTVAIERTNAQELSAPVFVNGPIFSTPELRAMEITSNILKIHIVIALHERHSFARCQRYRIAGRAIVPFHIFFGDFQGRHLLLAGPCYLITTVRTGSDFASVGAGYGEYGPQVPSGLTS